MTMICASGGKSRRESSKDEAQTYGGDQVDDQTGEGRFTGRPVRRPELAAEGEGDAFLRELLVDTGGGEGLENGYFFTTISTGGGIRTMVTTFCRSRSQYTDGHGMGQTYAGVRREQEGNMVRFASLSRNDRLTQEHCYVGQLRRSDETFEAYLRATNTVNAFCAFAPNTLLKNKLATVTPDFLISSFVAALHRIHSALFSTH